MNSDMPKFNGGVYAFFICAANPCIGIHRVRVMRADRYAGTWEYSIMSQYPSSTDPSYVTPHRTLKSEFTCLGNRLWETPEEALEQALNYVLPERIKGYRSAADKLQEWVDQMKGGHNGE